RRIFYRRGLWPNLLKLIDAEIRYARDDAERASLAAEKATILADRLDQRDAAKQSFEQALAYDPHHLPALQALERFALADGDTAALAQLWPQLAAASTTPERKLGYLRDA